MPRAATFFGRRGGLIEPSDRIIAGRFRLREKLGQGGMGSVFRAEDTAENGRSVAIKLLEHEPRLAKSLALRFRREFHALAQLKHPNIVSAWDFGVDDGQHWYTMEFLDGTDLREVSPMPPAAACRVLRDVASALSLLHARRLVHRDLSTRNVRQTSTGHTKLIDFGLLSTVGATATPMGTPPFVPPECWGRATIDHRTDLFSLGALAYFVLTGRHAFHAQHVTELPALWATPVVPPSTLASGISPELDALVVSMLSTDPLGRPASASEVMDRLAAIAGIAVDDERDARQGYLASAAMVGRRREQNALRRVLLRSVKGHGASVLIEAASGMGKSRLLRALQVEGRVLGATVLDGRGSSDDGAPFGLLRELALGLIRAAPDTAHEAALSRWGELVRLVPELQSLHAQSALQVNNDVLPADAPPEERRFVLQDAVVDWFLAASARTPLVLLGDDVQRADEASCAVLAVLADRAPSTQLLIVLAQRTDEPARAPAAIAAFREVSSRVRLRSLRERDVVDLVRSMFGDTPHAAQLGRQLMQLGGGSPLLCTELLRAWVDTDRVRYRDGAWVIPDALKAGALPPSVAGAMNARIAKLGVHARSLAQPLSLIGGVASLELCAALTGPDAHGQLFVAIDELIEQEVLVADTECVQFRHDGLREAVLRGLGADQSRELHGRIAAALASQASPSDLELGRHLLLGGRELEGAQLLASAGRRLFELQSFTEAIRALEPALEVYQRHARSPAECLELQQLLMSCGQFTDSQTMVRHAASAIKAIAHYSGLATAATLARYVDPRLAFGLGLGWAWVRWFFTPRARRGPRPMNALVAAFELVPPAAATFALLFREEETVALVDALKPACALKGTIAEASWLIASSSVAMLQGRPQDLFRDLKLALDIINKDRSTPISELTRKLLQSVPRHIMGVYEAMDIDPRVDLQIDALEQTGMRCFRVSAQVLRLVKHRFRGEEEIARAIERELELAFVQGGSMWMWESEVSWVSVMAFSCSQDLLGMRRCIEQLEQRVSDDVVPVLALARGEYHRMRGEPQRARELLEGPVRQFDGTSYFMLPELKAGLAEVVLELGEPDRAERLAKEVLAMPTMSAIGGCTLRLRLEWILAGAEAHRGDTEGAAIRLDAVLARAADRGGPTIVTMLNEHRARLAMKMGDLGSYAQHLEAMRVAATPTRNPALIGRIAAVRALGASRDLPAPPDETHTVSGERTDNVPPQVALGPSTQKLPPLDDGPLLTGCRTREDRAALALSLLLTAARAPAGALYLVTHGSIDLAALKGLSAPGPDVETSILAVLTGQSVSPRVHLLRTNDSSPTGAQKPVALVYLEEGAPPPAQLSERLARALVEAGDVSG